MTAATAALVERAARNGARVRLKPLEYVRLFGPPAANCRDCTHERPSDHDAGGKLDRAVLADLAAKADRGPATWGESAFPSVPGIAARIGYSERSVQYSLRRLETSGFIELVERPGRTNVCRILRPVEPLGSAELEPEPPVDDVGDNRPQGGAMVAPGGAMVAPDRSYLPTDHPPKAPLLGLGNVDGADAPADAAPQRRGEDLLRPEDLAGHAAGASYGALAGLSATQPADDPPRRLSRLRALRTRRCPRCGALPGEACRNASGRLRKANHAERRMPDVYGPAARAGLWRPAADPDAPAF